MRARSRHNKIGGSTEGPAETPTAEGSPPPDTAAVASAQPAGPDDIMSYLGNLPLAARSMPLDRLTDPF